jgi:hypothetical protein
MIADNEVRQRAFELWDEIRDHDKKCSLARVDKFYKASLAYLAMAQAEECLAKADDHQAHTIIALDRHSQRCLAGGSENRFLSEGEQDFDEGDVA